MQQSKSPISQRSLQSKSPISQKLDASHISGQMYQEPSVHEQESLPIIANTTFEYEEHKMPVEPTTPTNNSLLDFENM